MNHHCPVGHYDHFFYFKNSDAFLRLWQHEPFFSPTSQLCPPSRCSSKCSALLLLFCLRISTPLSGCLIRLWSFTSKSPGMPKFSGILITWRYAYFSSCVVHSCKTLKSTKKLVVCLKVVNFVCICRSKSLCSVRTKRLLSRISPQAK